MPSNTANQKEHEVYDPSKLETGEKGASTRQAAKKREARVNPSRMRPVSLRENTLQHNWRNTTDRQLK